MKCIKSSALLMSSFAIALSSLTAQELMETGGRKMPDEWIDRDTHHKVIRLVNTEGGNTSFYFHNNPFVGNKMVFYNSSRKNGRQLYTVDLHTRKVEPLTNHRGRISGEIVSPVRNEVFYQVKDSVFATGIDSKKERLVFVFPPDFKAGITTINADGTLLAGAWSSDAEKEISRSNPAKKDYFNKIYEAKLPRTLFTIDIRNKTLKKIFSDSAWLNHVQFSPTDPAILLFCHEGPWHKVDRIWTIDVHKPSRPVLMHHRSMDMEIAGHEWFAPDGKTIWYDLQLPRGKTFFVAGTDIKTLQEKKFRLERDEWSVHYTISPDQQVFAGDGGYAGSVAKSANGHWIYLFRPDGNRLIAEKLVNMKNHNYKLEPNVHFTPGGKRIIFRANFEGVPCIYAVEIAR